MIVEVADDKANGVADNKTGKWVGSVDGVVEGTNVATN